MRGGALLLIAAVYNSFFIVKSENKRPDDFCRFVYMYSVQEGGEVYQTFLPTKTRYVFWELNLSL